MVAKAAGSSAATSTISVNYGFEELKSNFSKTRVITVVNNGSSSATFSVAATNQAGSRPLA